MSFVQAGLDLSSYYAPSGYYTGGSYNPANWLPAPTAPTTDYAPAPVTSYGMYTPPTTAPINFFISTTDPNPAATIYANSVIAAAEETVVPMLADDERMTFQGTLSGSPFGGGSSATAGAGTGPTPVTPSIDFDRLIKIALLIGLATIIGSALVSRRSHK